MKWNTSKKVQSTSDTKAAMPVRGSGGVRRPYVTYRQKWDNERAIIEGLQRVTWVYRAVDAIASNAARQPLIFREGNPWDGETVDNQLYRILNSRPNEGEDSFAFRYRLSSQLLLSSKGVFVEVTRNRKGEVLSLVLLPPDHITIIPDSKKLIAGYELNMDIMVDGRRESVHKKYKPEEIVWIRKPHPFDPYGALTPLEAAGVAIETDWLAKMYNRNFMLNDGRPGGLIVVKGDMTEDDKEELRAKFAGSVARAGRISVIASEEGADFVDTAVTPRDAQYIDARKLTKEEILMAFGVPETVISNASGRTFDNAEIERLIFWMETMVPHLDLIVRPLDVLDNDEDVYLGYDLSRVDVLQRMEIKRREYTLREADAGAISFNEYREATGREMVDHPNADMLWIPANKNPYVTTDGDTPTDLAAMEPTGAPGRPPAANVTEQNDPSDREDPRMSPLDNTDTTPAAQLSANPVITKDLTSTAVNSEEIWVQITENAIKRFIGRCSRVVSEKSSGQKFKKAFFDTNSDVSEVVESIFDSDLWIKQLYEDLLPIARGIASEEAGIPEAEIKSIRGINLISEISKILEEKIIYERKNPKPNVSGFPDDIKSAFNEMGDSFIVHAESLKFANYYCNYNH
jgi:HK97 family phage portal protein